MLGYKVRKGFRVALLAGTCLAATPAAAQDAEFEARLNRLETLVMGLIFLGTGTLAVTRFVRSSRLRFKPRRHAIFPGDPWRESGRRLHRRSRS